MLLQSILIVTTKHRAAGVALALCYVELPRLGQRIQPAHGQRHRRCSSPHHHARNGLLNIAMGNAHGYENRIICSEGTFQIRTIRRLACSFRASPYVSHKHRAAGSALALCYVELPRLGQYLWCYALPESGRLPVYLKFMPVYRIFLFLH